MLASEYIVCPSAIKNVLYNSLPGDLEGIQIGLAHGGDCLSGVQ
jgi:hypothetical protein